MRGARSERRRLWRRGDVFDKTGSHLESSTRWQNLRHLLIREAPPPKAVRRLGALLDGTQAAPKAWMFDADPKCRQQRCSHICSNIQEAQ